MPRVWIIAVEHALFTGCARAAYNSDSYALLFTARQNNPDHPISWHPCHLPVSRRCRGGVTDPVFRRLNNSLFPDEDLFRCCGSGCSILWWTSLTAGPPAPPLLSFWLGRRCSSGQFLLSAVISGFPLSPLDNYFSRLLPLRREAAL